VRDCIACACVSPGLTVAVDPLGTIVTIPLLPLGGGVTIPHHDRDAGIVPGNGGGSSGGREGKSWMGVITMFVFSNRQTQLWLKSAAKVLVPVRPQNNNLFRNFFGNNRCTYKERIVRE